jgi:ketosteroid isomerase-like protein
MKYILLSVTLIGLLTSCNNNNQQHKRSPEEQKVRMDSLRGDLLKTDVAFSQLSEEKGRNAAFIEYASEEATFLRPNSMPVTGKDTIVSLFKLHPDTQFVLTWIPIRAEVARSGDLGFTYGTYNLDIKNIGKQEGSYCTIWEKDKDKKWKIALDVGNEGLKSADETTDKAIHAEVKKEMKKK